MNSITSIVLYLECCHHKKRRALITLAPSKAPPLFKLTIPLHLLLICIFETNYIRTTLQHNENNVLRATVHVCTCICALYCERWLFLLGTCTCTHERSHKILIVSYGVRSTCACMYMYK